MRIEPDASRVLSLEDAVRRHVSDGCSIYLAGFSHLINFAAAHEIIRQGKQRLTLVRMTPDLVYEQMVVAGCAERLVFSYLGNPGVGSLRAVKRALESGRLEWTEYTHGSMLAALRAGAAGASFAAVDDMGRSDLGQRNGDVRKVVCPFTLDEVAVVPPLRPDVAIVHGQRADAAGNLQIWGPVGEIYEAAHAARSVIVTAEAIVDSEVLRRDPDRTLALGMVADAVVAIPGACHPSFAQGYYARDNRFYRDWDETSATDEGVLRYLDEWVFALDGRAAYVEALGDRMRELAAVGRGWTEQINFGDSAAMAAVQD